MTMRMRLPGQRKWRLRLSKQRKRKCLFLFAFCLPVMHRLDLDSMILETIKFVAENEAFRAAQIENEAFQATQMQAFAFVLHFVCIL